MKPRTTFTSSLSIAVLLLLTAHCTLLTAHAQGTTTPRLMKTVPASCDPRGTNGPVIVWKTATTTDACSSAKGLCTCTATDTWTYSTNITTTGIAANRFVYTNSGSAVTVFPAASDGQFPIGDTSDPPALGSITGQANGITVTNSAHAIALSIATIFQHAAGANFLLTDPTDTTKKARFDLSGLTTATTRTYILPDASTTIPGNTPTTNALTKNTAAGNLVASRVTDDGTDVAIDSQGGATTFGDVGGVGNGTKVVVNDTAAQVEVSGDLQLSDNVYPLSLGSGSVGIPAKPFPSIVIGNAANNSSQITGTFGGNRVLTLPDATMTLAEGLLSTTAAVNMDTATATTLYTCPTGKSCVITKVVVRNASTSLTTASYSFGWTSAAFSDVIANATHTELTGATLFTILPAKAGAKLGASTNIFKVLMNTLQGGAATTTIDVFGYVF